MPSHHFVSPGVVRRPAQLETQGWELQIAEIGALQRGAEAK